MPTVVLLEDDPTLRLMYRRMFERHLGCEVDEATDGAEGLALIREKKPDVVVLDVHLPTMSGLEVLRELRDDPALNATPIIAITSENQRQVIEELLKARVLDILLKPVVLTRDVPRLERVLAKLG